MVRSHRLWIKADYIKLVSFLVFIPVNTTTAATATYLPTFFATTQETTGTWAFQGDGLTWTAPDIPRQNIGAFLACGSGVPGVYVNLGA